MPALVRSLGGYAFQTDPLKVQRGEQEAMLTFTGPLRRPEDQSDDCDQCVFDRFSEDGHRYPVTACTEQSLAWLAGRWRTPNAHEKAPIMGFPPSAVGLAPSPNPARLSDEKRSRVAATALSKWLTVGGAGVGDGIAPRGRCGDFPLSCGVG